MNRYTAFISDLHLSEDTPSTTSALLKFLENIEHQQITTLYILGDLFKFWVGDDNDSPFNHQIKTALKTVSNKIPVYLMAGNRDFLLGEQFAKTSGCKLILDPCVITLKGKKILLTHGDLLCDSSYKYHLFRKIIHLPFGIKVFLKLPITLRKWIASNMQKYSARSKQKNPPVDSVPQKKSLAKLISHHDFDQIIYGHVHRSATGEIKFDDNKTIAYTSLAEWHDLPQVLLLESAEK